MNQKRSGMPVVFMIVFLAVCGGTIVALGWKSFFGDKEQEPDDVAQVDPVEAVMRLSSPEMFAVENSLTSIKSNWDDRYLIMLIESLPYVDETIRQRIHALLVEKLDVYYDVLDPSWFLEIWKKPYNVFEEYATFKKRLYSEHRDKRFAEYFDVDFDTTIRLDEIQFGGVKRDGIPPLKDPLTLTVDEADYMDDSNIVFGVFVNGEARAYPKRILAWHEMVKDHVGGKSINGVYCTLCGSMVLYDTEIDGKHHELGTSGFLYRSNKLMYDQETKSLWSTLTGEPVVGALVGKGLKLRTMTVVTTTWGNWKALHPKTTVLSLDTGYERDYGEGVAYKNYFSNDELMFEVIHKKRALRNKEPILALRFGQGDAEKQLAISVRFLKSNPVYHGELAGQSFVVLTDQTGAARVYEKGSVKFKSWDEKEKATDESGNEWKVSEDALVNEKGDRLKRLPSHGAFWFGWYAAYPTTELVD